MVKTKNIITSLLMLVFWVSPVKSQDIKLWGTELQNAVFEQVTILLVGNVQDETHYKLGLEHRGINNPLDIILLANSISKDLGFTNVTYSLLLKGQVIFESSVDRIGLVQKTFLKTLPMILINPFILINTGLKLFFT